MDVATFRQVLPVFADTTAYPDAAIQFNIDLAKASLNPHVWGDRLEAGILYYAAHYVAVAGPRTVSSTSGATAGAGVPPQPPVGLVSSKSVGGVSVSYDLTTGQTQGGGIFNTTTWGRTFLTLLESTSAGVLQL